MKSRILGIGGTLLLLCVAARLPSSGNSAKLYALAQDHSPAFPIAFTRQSAVFEIDISEGSVRLLWNGTLQYGADFCAFATPSSHNGTLYLLTSSNSLMLVDLTTGKSTKQLSVSNRDEPRWYNALAYDEANSRVEGICNASMGWPSGLQWFTVDMAKGSLFYAKPLPLLRGSPLGACLFSSSLTKDSRLFWYYNENHQIVGFNVDSGSIQYVGFANVLGFNYDSKSGKLYGTKLTDNSFLPVVISEVTLVPPDQTNPPQPPEKVLYSLPNKFALAGTGASVLDNTGEMLYLLMTDQELDDHSPNGRLLIPNALVAINLKDGQTVTKKLNFQPFSFLASYEFLFSRLFFED